MAIFVWDSFELLSQLAPDTRPLCQLKMIYDTKRSWGKQNERVNVRPKRTVRTRLITSDPRNCPEQLPTWFKAD